MACAAGSRRTREATKNTSPRARIATVTVMMLIPSKSCGTPKPKRSVPELASMPTTAMRRPSTSEAIPLSGASATTEEVGQLAIPLLGGALAAPLGPAGAIWFSCAVLALSGAELSVRGRRRR